MTRTGVSTRHTLFRSLEDNRDGIGVLNSSWKTPAVWMLTQVRTHGDLTYLDVGAWNRV